MAKVMDKLKAIKKLDGVFRYKLNQEVEFNLFNDIWIKGYVLFRCYKDYDRHNDTEVFLSYTINSDKGIYKDVQEIHIREIKK